MKGIGWAMINRLTNLIGAIIIPLQNILFRCFFLATIILCSDSLVVTPSSVVFTLHSKEMAGVVPMVSLAKDDGQKY